MRGTKTAVAFTAVLVCGCVATGRLPGYPYASQPMRKGLDFDCPDLSGVFEYRADTSGISAGLSHLFLRDAYDDDATQVEVEGPKSGIITVKVYAGANLLKSGKARSPDDFVCADYQVRVSARSSKESDIAIFRLQDGSIAALYASTSWAVIGPVLAAHTSGQWFQWKAVRPVSD